MTTWKWCNEEKVNAFTPTAEGGFMVCGINCEPLKSWLEDGNEPEPAEAPADKE